MGKKVIDPITARNLSPYAAKTSSPAPSQRRASSFEICWPDGEEQATTRPEPQKAPFDGPEVLFIRSDCHSILVSSRWLPITG